MYCYTSIALVLLRACHGPTLVGRLINVSEDGPRPGPAHHFSKIHGPARPIIFSQVSPRPGPAHDLAARPMRHGLYMGRPDNRDEPGQERRAACVAETARSVVCIMNTSYQKLPFLSSVRPQLYQGCDPIVFMIQTTLLAVSATFARGIILYYTPEAISQKCIIRRYENWSLIFGD